MQHTPVTWAQRKDKVFVTLCVDDCKTPDIKVDANNLHFRGVGGSERRSYECDLELYAEIDPDVTKYAVRDRNIEFVLIKKDTSAEYWPRLLKEKAKVHWLKVDFTKWKDEDDSDNEKDMDLNDMMRNMGGLEGGGDGNFGNMMGSDDMSDDSDDEELPDLEGAPLPADEAMGNGEGEEEGEEGKAPAPTKTDPPSEAAAAPETASNGAAAPTA